MVRFCLAEAAIWAEECSRLQPNAEGIVLAQNEIEIRDLRCIPAGVCLNVSSRAVPRHIQAFCIVRSPLFYACDLRTSTLSMLILSRSFCSRVSIVRTEHPSRRAVTA